MSSSWKEPSSRRYSILSRAVIFPLEWCRSTEASLPACKACSLRSASSVKRSAIECSIEGQANAPRHPPGSRSAGPHRGSGGAQAGGARPLQWGSGCCSSLTRRDCRTPGHGLSSSVCHVGLRPSAVTASHMGSPFQYREVARAHNRPARPQGTSGQGDKDQDPGPEGRAPAAGCLHACVHDDTEEAELGPAQGGPCPPLLGRRDHGLHPRRRPQPPGALHRPRQGWSCEGPARCPLQGGPGCPRHLRACASAARPAAATARRRSPNAP